MPGTYISNMEPQDDLFGLLCDACLVHRSAARRVIAALMDDIFPWVVHFRSVVWHLDHLLVGPLAPSIFLRSLHVLADFCKDRR